MYNIFVYIFLKSAIIHNIYTHINSIVGIAQRNVLACGQKPRGG